MCDDGCCMSVCVCNIVVYGQVVVSVVMFQCVYACGCKMTDFGALMFDILVSRCDYVVLCVCVGVQSRLYLSK